MRVALTRLVAAVSLTAAAGLAAAVGAASPAAAAACPTSSGATVVVDFNGLGGGVREVCDADGGGKKASVLFPDAGYPLTYAQRQPGFVCRVQGVPTSDPCVNTSPPDAYWSLWWSDGRSGSWTYASVGVGSLTIPEGGYVGFSWNSGGGREAPSSNPAAHASQPPPSSPSSPQPAPSQGSGGSGGSSGSGGSGGSTGPGGGSATGGAGGTGGSATGGSTSGGSPSATASTDPSGSPTEDGSEAGGAAAETKAAKALRRAARAARAAERESEEPDPSASAVPTDEADLEVEDSEQLAPTASPPAADDGLPVWVAPGVVVLLLASALGTLLARRRATGGA